REMQRVLAPQGQLMIIGFNPFSALGAMAYSKGLSRRSMWHHHYPVSAHRVTDWLHLLGCEVQRSNYLYAVPPLGTGKIRDLMMRCDAWFNTHNAPVGGLYILHAVKQSIGLNRPRRRLLASGERLIDLAVPKPRGVPSPAPSVHKESA
ncbi:MAG: class I SAM-dependent methyltransferase, partial [Halioglobus sp.]